MHLKKCCDNIGLKLNIELYLYKDSVCDPLFRVICSFFISLIFLCAYLLCCIFLRHVYIHVYMPHVSSCFLSNDLYFREFFETGARVTTHWGSIIVTSQLARLFSNWMLAMSQWITLITEFLFRRACAQRHRLTNTNLRFPPQNRAYLCLFTKRKLWLRRPSILNLRTPKNVSIPSSKMICCQLHLSCRLWRLVSSITVSCSLTSLKHR